MGSIKATHSYLTDYYKASKVNYGQILTIVENMMKRSEKYRNEVAKMLDSLQIQTSKLETMSSEAERKMESYQEQMDIYQEKVRAAQATIDHYRSHPITETKTDSDGNTVTTQTYDYAAINAADREKTAAYEQYTRYKRLYDEASAVYNEISVLKNKLYQLQKAVEKGYDIICDAANSIKKSGNLIYDEADYNLRAVSNVIRELECYLRCSAIETYVCMVEANFDNGMSTGGYSYGGATTYGYDPACGDASSTYDGVDGESAGVDASLIYGDAPETSNNDSATESADGNKVNNHVAEGDSQGDRILNDVVLPAVEYLEHDDEQFELPDANKQKNYEKFYDNYCKNAEKYALLSSIEYALKLYSGSAYDKVNKYLRKNEATSHEDEMHCQTLIGPITQHIEKSRLPIGMMLYRGISGPDHILGKDWKHKTIDQLNKNLVGTFYTDKGFCSTSVSMDVAKKFSDTEYGVTCIITAPKGARGCLLGNTSNHPHEKEVLLQRNSGFRICSIKNDPRNNGFIVELTLIGRERIHELR